MSKNSNPFIVHANFAKGFRGGERQTQLLIESLSEDNYSQKLLVRKNSQLAQRCKDIKNLQIIELSKPYFLHAKHTKDADIIHAHETKALQFAYISHLLFGIEYIVTRRVDNPIKRNFLNKLMYEKASVCVALSKAIEKQIKRVSPDAKCSIIPSAFAGFSSSEIRKKKIKERFKNLFLIGHIGALDNRQKGQSYLIEAMKVLQKEYSDIHLILLGSGKDEEYLKELSKDMDNITFEGFVENIGDYMACMDLFVFPSLNEGLGSTLLDVMNFDVPIIATAVGGIVDIIEDEKNGLLISAKDVDSMVSRIKDLYSNDKKRERLAAEAKEYVKQFSVENMCRSYKKLYRVTEE